MKLQRMLIGTMAALAVATAAAAVLQPVQERQGILTSATGHTLYVNGIDAPGRSNCNGACARAWPPYVAREGVEATGSMSLITRDDGALQWAYAGRPLYFSSADARPGEAKGDGVEGVWSVVRAAAVEGGGRVATVTPAHYRTPAPSRKVW